MNELTNLQLYTVTQKRITGVNIHSGKEAFGALVSCDANIGLNATLKKHNPDGPEYKYYIQPDNGPCLLVTHFKSQP